LSSAFLASGQDPLDDLQLLTVESVDALIVVLTLEVAVTLKTALKLEARFFQGFEAGGIEVVGVRIDLLEVQVGEQVFEEKGKGNNAVPVTGSLRFEIDPEEAVPVIETVVVEVDRPNDPPLQLDDHLNPALTDRVIEELLAELLEAYGVVAR